jgi:hypothetical protein
MVSFTTCMFENYTWKAMELKKPYKLNLTYEDESHDVTVKVTTFPNGYKTARLIIEHRQYWALYDLISWKLMSDCHISKMLKIQLLRHLKNNARRNIVHRSNA